jgi:mono/diheme cytochrome c family protein
LWLAVLFLSFKDYERLAASDEVAPENRQSSTSGAPTYLRDVLPIFIGKCARCHNEQTQILPNWLDYHTSASRRWEIKRRVWDSWEGTYFKQPMPAGNSPEFQAMTEAERTIVRDWVEKGAALGVRSSTRSAHSKAERIELGKSLFTSLCATCHQPTGTGIPARFPPLAGSDFLNSDKHRAIKVVVNGLQGEITVNGQKFNNSMPKFPLSDDDIANALTFVYNSFGNSGKEVTPGEVMFVRGEQDDMPQNHRNQTARTPQEKSPFE